jgi:hypothetical protein
MRESGMPAPPKFTAGRALLFFDDASLHGRGA